MPIYEYDCPQCGRFEVLQRLSDPPLRKHECGNKVHKTMSAGAFAFRGSGFHATDYRPAAPSCEKPKGAACNGCPSNASA